MASTSMFTFFGSFSSRLGHIFENSMRTGRSGSARSTSGKRLGYCLPSRLKIGRRTLHLIFEEHERPDEPSATR